MDNESTNAFIDCIIAYSTNLESNSVSEDLEVSNCFILSNFHFRICSID